MVEGHGEHVLVDVVPVDAVGLGDEGAVGAGAHGGDATGGPADRCPQARGTPWTGCGRAPTVVDVKIAEALTERADAQRRVEQLRSRIAANARYQEGEEPAEDAAALLVEVGEVLTRLRTLIAQVNRTNSRVDLGPDGTMTDALATRDVLRLQHAVLTSAADAAAGQGRGTCAASCGTSRPCPSPTCAGRPTRWRARCAPSTAASSRRTGPTTCWTGRSRTGRRVRGGGSR